MTKDKKMFSRQHYNFIAEAVRAMDVEVTLRLTVASGLADYLQHDNPNFDRVKFIEACMSDDVPLVVGA